MQDVQSVQEWVQREAAAIDRVMTEVRKVIVGQRYLLDRMMIGLISGGHLLLEGVPGLAKTLAVRTLAAAVRGSFQRLQFTPDLLPADLTGTLIFNQRENRFEPRKGPLFANFVLADEINRAPAKVQSALLEAMQERQVTIGDTSYALPQPFLVLATQNPIEQEGTYPLPEAQVDRFMLKLRVDYPTPEEEREILDRMSVAQPPEPSPVLTLDELERVRAALQAIYVDERIKDYAVRLVHATRRPREYKLDLEGLVQYGASPRATLYLVGAARAHAFLRGRGFVTPEDVKAIGADVLRHRLILSFEAEAESVTPDAIIQRVFDAVEVP
ncbi:MAG TPA: MoxR family ATPase [Candidatus Polarisedimenticolaceae bacterium]|nr:MoxR family ATPase [Candidatus Polarisedimenticolaceae bacterium]